MFYNFDMHNTVGFQRHSLNAVTTTSTRVETDIHTTYPYLDGKQPVCCGYVLSNKHRKSKQPTATKTHESEREARRHTSLNVNGETAESVPRNSSAFGFRHTKHNR